MAQSNIPAQPNTPAQSNMGQLSQLDISAEKNSNSIDINPFDERCLKGASYDISPTIIAMSAKFGMLEKVYQSTKYPYKYYIYVQAKDTVLILSKEYIRISEKMAGYVVSRVSKVIEGFGHVCTSIDPNWEGALLIALSNPSSRPIKIEVGVGMASKSKGSETEQTATLANNSLNTLESLATVTFHYLNTPVQKTSSEYQGMRLDLLKEMRYNERKGFRAWWQKITRPYRRKFTDFFFSFCEIHDITAKTWNNIVLEFTGQATRENSPVDLIFFTKSTRKRPVHFSEFIIREHFLNRFYYWIRSHPQESFFWFITTAALIIHLLGALGIITPDFKEKFFNFLQSWPIFNS